MPAEASWQSVRCPWASVCALERSWWKLPRFHTFFVSTVWVIWTDVHYILVWSDVRRWKVSLSSIHYLKCPFAKVKKTDLFTTSQTFPNKKIHATKSGAVWILLTCSSYFAALLVSASVFSIAWDVWRPKSLWVVQSWTASLVWWMLWEGCWYVCLWITPVSWLKKNNGRV